MKFINKSIYIFLIIFLCILFISPLNAFEFSVSPPSVEFDESNRDCKIIEIRSDKRINVDVRDVWSEIDTDEIEYYNFNANQLGIKINYEKEFYLNEIKQFEICVDFMDKEAYRGALLLNPRGRNVELVVWINRNANLELSEFSDFEDYLTGNLVNENKDLNYDSKKLFYILFLAILNILLLILLIFLIYLFRKRQSRIV